MTYKPAGPSSSMVPIEGSASGASLASKLVRANVGKPLHGQPLVPLQY